LQQELAEHQEILATLKQNLAEVFGAGSESLAEFISHEAKLAPQLEEAGRLAALLQTEADDREKSRCQLDCDIQSLIEWLNGTEAELNELSVSSLLESCDEILRRYDTVKVVMHLL